MTRVDSSSRLAEMWADSLLILVISICTAFLGEGLTWLLVYRTDKYQVSRTGMKTSLPWLLIKIMRPFLLKQKLKLDMEKQTKKLEKKKEAVGDSALDRTQVRSQTSMFSCDSS